MLYADDAQYLQHLNKGGEDYLNFNVPNWDTMGNTSLFLHTKGYYEQIVDSEESPQYLTLLSFGRAGSYAKYSRDRYFEILNSKDNLTIISKWE